MRLPFPVVLASGSPRRRELLQSILEEFEILSPNVDESPIPGESPEEMVTRLANLKMEAVRRERLGTLIVAGDTVVAIEDGDGWQMLSKPEDVPDAQGMLRRLSGRTHEVMTGICVAWPYGVVVGSDRTRVTFRDLSDAEIAEYVAGGEPMDKAGAYAIQGGAAGFVTNIDGSLTNVIGLPMERIEAVLRHIEATIPPAPDR